jgi:uncharacterized membrane protein YuzA (DUF378 family)
MKGMSVIDVVVTLLVVVGGLNWGLVGAFNMDLVALVFGAGSVFAKVVYVLVGLAAVYMLYGVFVKGKGG